MKWPKQHLEFLCDDGEVMGKVGMGDDHSLGGRGGTGGVLEEARVVGRGSLGFVQEEGEGGRVGGIGGLELVGG